MESPVPGPESEGGGRSKEIVRLPDRQENFLRAHNARWLIVLEQRGLDATFDETHAVWFVELEFEGNRSSRTETDVLRERCDGEVGSERNRASASTRK